MRLVGFSVREHIDDRLKERFLLEVATVGVLESLNLAVLEQKVLELPLALDPRHKFLVADGSALVRIDDAEHLVGKLLDLAELGRLNRRQLTQAAYHRLVSYHQLLLFYESTVIKIEHLKNKLDSFVVLLVRQNHERGQHLVHVHSALLGMSVIEQHKYFVGIFVQIHSENIIEFLIIETAMRRVKRANKLH